MRWFYKLPLRFRSLFRKGRVEQELTDELRFHLEKLIEENIARGMTPEEARYAALRELGGLEQIKEECRDARGVNYIESFVQDVRYGLRQLRRSPGFTIVAVLTLALGIGANTAIFSVVNAIFLRPLPFPQAARIYLVRRVGNWFGGGSISFPIYLAWQEEQRFFEHLALVQWMNDSTLTGNGEPERVPSAGASTELFSLLGVQPALGRDFNPEEGRPGGTNVVILSDSLWRTRFGADRDILGGTITLNDAPYTVIGVLPRGFELPIPGVRNAELWFPVQVPLTSNDPSNGGLLCLGLLKANWTPAEAEAALTPPLAELRREFPKMFAPDERAHVQPLRSFLADWAGPAPLLLFGAVTLVLLIACANVASLTLVRSTSRQREIAIRTSIGAGRGRITRQLLTESVLLALLGGGLGVLACHASFDVILSLIPADLPHVGAIKFDRQVLIFALLLSFITGIVFGIVPAVSASRGDLNAGLKEASVQIGLSGHGRLRNALVVSEVSISLVLLIGAALALESFVKLMRVPPGFDPHNLLTFKVTLPGKKYDTPAKRAAFFGQAVTDISTLPGIDRAALVSVPPLEGGPDILFSIEGAGVPQSSENLGAEFRFVGSGYFQTLRIPLLRGRPFSASDNTETEPVVIINQTMAKMYWPDQNPLGQRIWVGKPMGPAETEPAPREIVGIVSDIREMSLAEPAVPTMYIPYPQHPQADEAYFVIRSRLNPLALFPDVRSTVQRLGPGLPLAEVRTMEQILAGSLTDWRFHAILLGAFGALALFIAAIGIYGVISYSVAQRTHEIGIRMALGAGARDILTMVVREGAILAVIGIAVGLFAAFGLTRLMTSLLYGVRATDPLTFVAVSLLLTGVALLASYIPARRATKVDPMVALRYE